MTNSSDRKTNGSADVLDGNAARIYSLHGGPPGWVRLRASVFSMSADLFQAAVKAL
jgi:hypothetical protein